MARIRTVKPEFFTSDDVVALTFQSRLLYIALWCEADREGRFVWQPSAFKRRYFPDDAVDITAMCGELTDRGLIVLYGDGLAHIPTFAKHQHVNPRESKSTLPEPPKPRKIVASARDNDASSRVSDAQVGKEGKEGKGREGKDIPTSSGAEAPGLGLVELNAEMWRTAKVYVSQHARGHDAGALLGMWRKSLGDDGVSQMLRAAQVAAISDLVPWAQKYISTRARPRDAPRQVQAVTPMGPAGG